MHLKKKQNKKTSKQNTFQQYLESRQIALLLVNIVVAEKKGQR